MAALFYTQHGPPNGLPNGPPNGPKWALKLLTKNATGITLLNIFGTKKATNRAQTMAHPKHRKPKPLDLPNLHRIYPGKPVKILNCSNVFQLKKTDQGGIKDHTSDI